MRTEVKAAIAGTVGVVLLLGGAGTLAYWSDSETVTGEPNLQSGHLALLTDATNTGCGAWTLDAGEVTASTYLSGDPLVPGDVLTKVCTFTIDAEGNHLRATVGVSTPTLTASTGSLDNSVTVDVSGTTVDGVAATSFTEDADGLPLEATITVTFASTADNDTQDFVAALSDMTLSVQQVHNP